MKYTADFAITSHDIDMNNHIRPSMLVIYMQETANHQMRDRRPSYDELFASGTALIQTRMTVSVLHQLRQYDRIRVGTWRCGDSRATFFRGYSVECGGELCALGYSEWTAVNLADRSIRPVSEVDLSNYEEDAVPELTVPRKFRIPRGTVFEEVGTHRVTYDEVDLNSHMNNTKYPDLLWAEIPGIDKMDVTSINLRFRREALWGSELTISRAEIPVEASGDPFAERAFALETKIGKDKNIEAIFGVRHAAADSRAHEVRK